MKSPMLAAMLVLAGAVSWATPTLNTTNLITELMMNDQITNASLLALLFGPDFSSQVTYTTFVDPASLSFTFSSQAGSMYLGQRLILSGSGVFYPNTDVMSLASSGALGSSQWSTSGQFFVTGDSNGYQFMGQESLFTGFGPLPPSHCLEWKFVRATLYDDGTSLARGIWQDVCRGRHGVWDSTDIYAQEYENGPLVIETTVFGEEQTFFVDEDGFSHREGGMGQQVIRYSSTAEPSSFLLLAIGVLGVANGDPSQIFSLTASG